MKSRSVLRKLSLGFAAVLMVVAGACSSDSPSEPTASPNPPPGTGGGGSTTYNVTVTASPSSVAAGATDPVIITVRAVRADNGAPPPNGTAAQVSAFVGSFGAPGGDDSAILQLTNGTAQVTYFVPADVSDAVTVTATVAGNSGRTTIQVEEPDTFFIAGVSPNSGSPVGGEIVTINGNGFEPPARVAFGGANAEVLSVNPTSIRVRTPESPSPANERATVAVSVTINVNEEKQASDTLTGAFTFAPGGPDNNQAPTVLSASPTTGPNEGGTRVRIIGSGFQSPVQVEFGSGGTFLEAEVESVQSNELVVRTPAATGFGSALRDQTVDIRVRNLNSGLAATFASAFRYGTEVRITSLSPSQGPYFGGQLVTIFGQGFDAPVAVEMGGRAQQIISVTGTEIVVRTVAIITESCADEIGPVSVVNIETAGSATGPDYRYQVAQFTPIIFSVSPSSGPQGGGTVLTVRGENLLDPLASVAGRPAEVLSVAGDGSEITIRTPFLPREEFTTEACDDNADGTSGERFVPTAVNVTVVNRLTSCQVTFEDGFVFNPSDSSCRNDVGPPPETVVECADGFDNDGDGFIDAADPQCTGPDDNDESA